MDPLLADVLRLSIIVLLPIIPAFLLFKALPSKAVVTGPFQGLKINLGGSFAGYFAIFLIVLSTHSVWNPYPIQVWSVDGTVLDENGNPVSFLQTTDIRVDPPPIRVVGEGTFHLQFATELGPAGYFNYPTITITRDTSVRTIPLEPRKGSPDSDLKIEWDAKKQQINIPRVVLHHIPEYSPKGPAPAPANSPSRP